MTQTLTDRPTHYKLLDWREGECAGGYTEQGASAAIVNEVQSLLQATWWPSIATHRDLEYPFAIACAITCITIYSHSESVLVRAAACTEFEQRGYTREIKLFKEGLYSLEIYPVRPS